MRGIEDLAARVEQQLADTRAKGGGVAEWYLQTPDLIRLVGDGVYLRALLGVPPIEPDRYRRVVERLLGDRPA